MAIKSLGPYNFPSRSAQEFYGDDMLVHVVRRDSLFYCSPVALRVPRNMKWKDFVDTQVLPWISADPDFKPADQYAWTLVEAPFSPQDDKTLTELGINHKNTVGINHVS